MRGQQVGLTETARLDVSGATGGGMLRVGGGFQGKDGAPNAQQTVVWPGATLLADAGTAGDGCGRQHHDHGHRGGGTSNNFGVVLLGAAIQILAINGAITIGGFGGGGGASGVFATGGFVAPAFPCGPCGNTANLDAGAGGAVTINSSPP